MKHVDSNEVCYDIFSLVSNDRNIDCGSQLEDASSWVQGLYAYYVQAWLGLLFNRLTCVRQSLDVIYSCL